MWKRYAQDSKDRKLMSSSEKCRNIKLIRLMKIHRGSSRRTMIRCPNSRLRGRNLSFDALLKLRPSRLFEPRLQPHGVTGDIIRRNHPLRRPAEKIVVKH